MHSHDKEHKHGEGMEEECGCEGGHHDCGEGDCECCCEPKEMTKEEAQLMLTKVATDVWMKMFIEACEKEWKKQHGKNIQKMASEHVKKAKKEWDAQMK